MDEPLALDYNMSSLFNFDDLVNASQVEDSLNDNEELTIQVENTTKSKPDKPKTPPKKTKKRNKNKKGRRNNKNKNKKS